MACVSRAWSCWLRAAEMARLGGRRRRERTYRLPGTGAPAGAQWPSPHVHDEPCCCGPCPCAAKLPGDARTLPDAAEKVTCRVARDSAPLRPRSGYKPSLIVVAATAAAAPARPPLPFPHRATLISAEAVAGRSRSRAAPHGVSAATGVS